MVDRDDLRTDKCDERTQGYDSRGLELTLINSDTGKRISSDKVLERSARPASDSDEEL